jgi:transketolase
MAHGHNTSIFALSRQNLPTLDRSVCAAASGTLRGGYVLLESGGTDGAKPDVILMGTGSEVHLCLSAHAALAAGGVRVRTVSLPCTQLFDRQDAAYRESVLPSSVRARVSVEMAATFGWERYVGLDGETVGMTTFGASAPIKDLLPHFGFTTDSVVARAKATMVRCGVSK